MDRQTGEEQSYLINADSENGQAEHVEQQVVGKQGYPIALTHSDVDAVWDSREASHSLSSQSMASLGVHHQGRRRRRFVRAPVGVPSGRPVRFVRLLLRMLDVSSSSSSHRHALSSSPSSDDFRRSYRIAGAGRIELLHHPHAHSVQERHPMYVAFISFTSAMPSAH